MNKITPSDYEMLFQRVALQVQPCPRVVMLDAVQTVAADFFTRSEVWRETLLASVFSGERFADIPMERGTALVRAEEILLDGDRLEGGVHYAVRQSGGGATIEFAFEPDRDRTAYIASVMRPSRMATSIPAHFMEEWVDILAFGTLAKLKSMSGQHVGWTDPQGAALNLQLYEDGLTRARASAVRGRDGRRLVVNQR